MLLINAFSNTNLMVHFSFVAAAVPKDWRFKNIFDAKLLQILESGTLDSMLHHWENEMPDCKTIAEDEASLALGPGSIWCYNRYYMVL